MRIYIAEDDPSVIGVLEDILESSALGRVCGASEEGAPDPERIMALDPDLVLVDLLMPGRDGIQLVRELKEPGSRAKFVMISQEGPPHHPERVSEPGVPARRSGGAAGGVAPAHPVHPEPAGHGRGEGGRGHHGAVPLPAGAKADGLSDRSGHPVQPAQ